MSSLPLKAVIFDIGGVVVRSPLLAIDDYEREKGIPRNYINIAIARRGKHGAWQRFERGELDLFSFYDEFGRELSDTFTCNTWYSEYCQLRKLACPNLPENIQIDGRDLFGRMMRESSVWDENMVEAIRRIKGAKKWRVIALTNNYSKAEETLSPLNARSTTMKTRNPNLDLDNERAFLGWTEGATPPKLRALFDDFCDSSSFGMRKPDPEFYLLACRRNGVQPNECVFLDDLGMNLKVARELGMKTIHVRIGGAFTAIKELETILGIDLTSPGTRSKI